MNSSNSSGKTPTRTTSRTTLIAPIESSATLSEALTYLRAGWPIAFPTDTIYGIGVPALNEEAIHRLYEVKRRPYSSPIPVLLADSADVSQVVANFPPAANNLAQRYWPGGLSLIVSAAAHLPAQLVAEDKTVSVRVPNHAWLRLLIRRLGQPLATTSANLHSHPNTTTAHEVAAQIGADIPFIVDGGATPGAVPSTIVRCTTPELQIIRQGVVVIETK
jgi:L-threonylcarbamoyladenylate synthase